MAKLSKAEQDRLNCLLGDLKIVRASGLSLAAVVMETNVLYVNPPMIDVGAVRLGQRERLPQHPIPRGQAPAAKRLPLL